MYDRLVVPLDGSETAEAVLPYVELLSQRLNAQVQLLQAVNPPLVSPYAAETYVAPNVYQQIIDAENAAAADYLNRIAERLRARGINPTTQVIFGPATTAIVDATTEADAEIVAMTTHGRTGLARFALGSVAELVVREAQAPVFLVRAFGEQPQSLDNILVPLDGSAVAEAVLPVVEALVPALGARVLLLRATNGDESGSTGGEYLQQVAGRLRENGIGEVDHETVRGSPADAILDATGRVGADLIAMATHGRGGVGRWVFGSVAYRVVHAATVPTLLVRGRG